MATRVRGKVIIHKRLHLNRLGLGFEPTPRNFTFLRFNFFTPVFWAYYLRCTSLSDPQHGYHLARKAWVQLNRIRSGVGRCGAYQKKQALLRQICAFVDSDKMVKHILLNCQRLRSPCWLSDTESPAHLPVTAMLLMTKPGPCAQERKSLFISLRCGLVHLRKKQGAKRTARLTALQ